MDDNQAGPSGAKRPRKCAKKWESKRTLTNKELEDYLLDSDDDIADPDFEVSDSECTFSGDSEDEEAEIPILEDLDLDVTADILNFADLGTGVKTQEATTQETTNAPVTWEAKEAIPKQIPFTRKRELLIQPNGKS